MFHLYIKTHNKIVQEAEREKASKLSHQLSVNLNNHVGGRSIEESGFHKRIAELEAELAAERESFQCYVDTNEALLEARTLISELEDREINAWLVCAEICREAGHPDLSVKINEEEARSHRVGNGE